MKKKIDYPEIDIEEADSIFYSENKNAYYEIVKPFEWSNEKFIIKQDKPVLSDYPMMPFENGLVISVNLAIKLLLDIINKPYLPVRRSHDPFRMINIIRECESFPTQDSFLSRYSKALTEIYRVLLINSLVYPSMIIRGLIIGNVQSYFLNLSEQYEEFRVEKFCNHYGVLEESDCSVTLSKEVHYQDSNRIGFEDEKISVGRGQKLQTFKRVIREIIQRILYLRRLSKEKKSVCSVCESLYGLCKSKDKYPKKEQCDIYQHRIRREIAHIINDLIAKVYPELVTTEEFYKVLHRFESLKEEIGLYLLKVLLGEARLKRCGYCHKLFEVTFDQQKFCPPEKMSKNGKPYSKSPCKNLYDKYGPKREWNFNNY